MNSAKNCSLGPFHKLNFVMFFTYVMASLVLALVVKFQDLRGIWKSISQVAVPFVDINSAIQLAVGAYGWWKARNRTASLVKIINGNGGSLTPAFSFNPHAIMLLWK